MMKKIFYLLIIPMVIFTSCDDDDGYSLDKFWINMATVENPDNEAYFYMRLDNNDLLWIAATNYYNYTPRTGQRILADYTILNDRPAGSIYQHDVKLNDAYNILTKDIFYITPATQDSIGNDPVGINDMWVGGDFLNVRFYYPGNNKIHFINLVKDLSVEPQETGTIHLELRHNANDDTETFRRYGMVCFNLMSLFTQTSTTPQRVNLVIHIKNIDGNDITKEFIYDPENKQVSPKEFSRDDFQEHKNVSIE